MFKIFDVDSKKIKAIAVIMYKRYEISVSTVFENQIAVFLVQDYNAQGYYQDKDGNKMTNLEQAIELIDSVLESTKVIELVTIDKLDQIGDKSKCDLCPYHHTSKCEDVNCDGGYFRVVE